MENSDESNGSNEDNGNIEKLTRSWFKFYLAPCVSDDDFI